MIQEKLQVHYENSIAKSNISQKNLPENTNIKNSNCNHNDNCDDDDKVKYLIEYVWDEKDPGLKAEIINFWMQEKALPNRKMAIDRLDEVIYIVRLKENGKVVAVMTTYKQFNNLLSHYFYYLRCYVGSNYRRNSLCAQLVCTARDRLNDRFVSGEEHEAIGLITEYENKALNQYRNEAICGKTGLTFIGYNEHRQQVRVYYFDKAMI